jgi:acetate kinase
MAWTGDIYHVEVMRLDDAIEVGVFVLPTNEESAMASIAERIIKAPL